DIEALFPAPSTFRERFPDSRRNQGGVVSEMSRRPWGEHAAMQPPDEFSGLPEEELQHRYREGIGSALQALLQLHDQALRQCLHHWTRDTEQAEEAWSKFLLHLARPDVQARYDSSQPWLPWARTVLRHLITDVQRRELRRQRILPEPQGGF